MAQYGQKRTMERGVDFYCIFADVFMDDVSLEQPDICNAIREYQSLTTFDANYRHTTVRFDVLYTSAP